MFDGWLAKVQRNIRAATPPIYGLDKAAGDNDSTTATDAARETAIETVVQQVVGGLDLDLDDEDMNDLVEVLTDAAQEAAQGAYAQVSVGEIGDDIFDQLNDRALDWAQDHAADLVSQIDDTTQDYIRAAITEGLNNGDGLDSIADDIEDITGFSAERAALIASTEITGANSQGALQGYKQARDDNGVTLFKAWLITDEACDICQDNSDAGPIDLDDDFPSGDDAPPAHPNCRCALTPITYESDESGTDSDDAGDSSPEDGETDDDD